MKPPQAKRNGGKNKKRKAQDDAPPPELEEGEVCPQAVLQLPLAHQYPPPHPAQGYPPQQKGYSDPYGPPPALSEAEVVPVVLELLSWGVHPGYLIQSGVSEAIISRALSLAYPSQPNPPPVAYQTAPNPDAHHHPNLAPTPVQELHVPPAALENPVHQSPPSPGPQTATPDDTARSTELALLEAKTREALLARKVRKAIAARKALADVDSFLASASASQPTTPSPPPAPTAQADLDPVPAVVARALSPVLAPAPAPAPAPIAHYFPRVNRRPAAADFLHPTGGWDHSVQPRSVFETNQPSQMVIEMSDSDDSDSDEEEAAVLAMILNKPVPVQNGTLGVNQLGSAGRISPGPPGAAAKRQLEAKEAEIKNAMDTIKRMELAKKASPGPSTPVTTADINSSASERPSVKERLAAAVAKAAEAKAKLAELEAARAKVAELKDERSGLLVEVAVEEAVAESRMEVDGPAIAKQGAISADPPAPPATAQSTHFAPYTSSLSSLTGTTITALQSFAARRHGIDSARALCAFEANGGVCPDSACDAIHASAFIASDEDVCEFVFTQVCPGTLSAPAKAVWKDGLEKALARVARPLTLAGGLAAGEVFAKRMAA